MIPTIAETTNKLFPKPENFTKDLLNSKNFNFNLGNADLSKIGNTAGNIAGDVAKDVVKDVGSKGGEAASQLSKFDKVMKGIDGVASGVGAAMAVAGTINSIIGTVEQQKAAKEQQKMAQKQYNLELKKLQQQELNENKLAATIDKTWGGDGKIANTLDYGNHAGDKANASGLHGSNQNHGYITSREDSNNNATESRSSLNTPTLSTQQAIAPAGYSESLSGKDKNFSEDDENATAS